ncbi:DUF4342 domain-containing protein [Clostridium formicaceticum]|uniref:Nascent polypeptide-associated complex protein n=1 Tax=Clostridium formicaceticum TaxID=1497 RepID=A0AAC9WGM8_9CLOT|nr:DUF4342 domain-containing protein [Clostridium formicaceticum]AOY77548.1 ubiquitin [Clostridium formicaceticum]ARE88123.1 nascent polypeptide-associated complex protein [Clostridium formicaceticum]
MDINLENIDIIRERTGVSYKKAKEALENAGGNVVEALIALEGENNSKWTKNMGMTGNEIIEKLKRVIEKGNVTRVILKKDDEVMLNIPITAGAIGVVLAPLASLLGISAALVTKTKIEIVQNDGKVLDLNEIAEEKVGDFRNMMKGNPTKENIDDILDDLDESGADF